MAVNKFLACLILFFVNVDCMSLHGPALTRYDPCGLGVVYFDHVMGALWQGNINLGLYRHLKEVEIEIIFDKRVTIYGTSHNSTMAGLDTEGHAYLIKPKGDIPRQYRLYVRLEGLINNDTNVPTVTKFALNKIVLCDDRIKAAQTIESLSISENTQLCGRRSLHHTELVTVRTKAQAGDWPWHVAILTRGPNNTLSYYCGGNIISPTAVVTAGHCVRRNGARIPTDTIIVVAGVSNHKKTDEPGRQTLPVLEVILHPSYEDALATADVAVLKVHKFTYTEYVQPICLWGPVYDKASLVGRQGTVVGFGHDENNQPSDVLRSTYIMVQNDTTCTKFSPNVYTNLMNEFTICAGYGPTSGINPRNGDSGGGLTFQVLQKDHKISYFLRGVLSKCGVSPGHTECDPKFYVVYTDVAPYYTWIYHHSGLQYRNNLVY